MGLANIKASGFDYVLKRMAYLTMAKVPYDFIEKRYRMEVIPRLQQIDVDTILKLFYKDLYSELQKENLSVNEYVRHPIHVMETPKVRGKDFTWRAIAIAGNEIKNRLESYVKEHYKDENVLARLKLIDSKTRPDKTHISDLRVEFVVHAFLIMNEFESLRTSYNAFQVLLGKWLIMNGDITGNEIFMEYMDRVTKLTCLKTKQYLNVDYKEIWDLINRAMGTDYQLDF